MIWLEIVLGFAVPIAFGVWQLWDLRRERIRDEAKRAALSRDDPVRPVVLADRPAEAPRHPER